MIGIYSLINRKNGKRYIGQSVQVSSRIHSHFRNLARKSHPNKILQKDYNTDSKFFNYEILEFNVPLHLLSQREAFWVNYYKTLDRAYGYNQQIITKTRKYTKKIKKYSKQKRKYVIVNRGV